MIYTTNEYNLRLGNAGRVTRIFKQFLYQICEVRSAVPEITLKENSPFFNDRYDTPAQTAAAFFQRWQNLKSHDGSVNYEIWMALGKFASEKNVEFNTFHDPILKIMLTNTTLNTNGNLTGITH